MKKNQNRIRRSLGSRIFDTANLIFLGLLAFSTVYPFWDSQAIVEIELNDENEEIRFPAELKVIREVTEDDGFKNASLARYSR